MKYANGFVWLLMAFGIQVVDVRAGAVDINPSMGLARNTTYGSIPGGPPTEETEYVPNIPGFPIAVVNAFEGRDWTGYVGDEMLLYDVRGLTSSSLVRATIEFQIDAVYRNGTPDIPAFADVYGRLAGTANGTLGADNYAAIPTSQFVFSVPAGINDDVIVMSVDITDAVRGLLAGGSDYASLLLQTYSNSIFGSSEIDFGQAPTLVIRTAGISPGGTVVPEASSIIHLSLSIVGLFLASLTRRPLVRSVLSRAE